MAPKLFTSAISVFIAFSMHSFVISDTEFTKITSRATQQPKLRLYVFDGGTLENMDTKRFGLESNEVAISRMSVPCFLIVHPKGTLIWDTGAVPDTSWSFTNSSIIYKLILPNLQRDITLTKPLKMQLAEAGYSPTEITYLALSHYHYDHTANANEFSNSIWLVRQNEHDSMFAKQPPGVTAPSTYSALRNNKTQIITSDQYDVFGDGTVIIKSAPGHTPGHQVLFLKLKQTGNILLSGDLYHNPEERVLGRVPTFDFNQEQTRSSRKIIDTFLRKTNARLWIQHDFGTNSKLKKAPDYYE